MKICDCCKIRENPNPDNDCYICQIHNHLAKMAEATRSMIREYDQIQYLIPHIQEPKITELLKSMPKPPDGMTTKEVKEEMTKALDKIYEVFHEI